MSELKASIYQGERQLLQDVAVDLGEQREEGHAVWGGSFQVNHPRQKIKGAGPYLMKLDDGRSGMIFIVDFDQTEESIDPWVSFRGSGTLR